MISYECMYCAGYRCECVCLTDCGIRVGHICVKAPVKIQIEWYRKTGLYSEAELERLRERLND